MRKILDAMNDHDMEKGTLEAEVEDTYLIESEINESGLLKYLNRLDSYILFVKKHTILDVDSIRHVVLVLGSFSLIGPFTIVNTSRSSNLFSVITSAMQ